MRDTAAANPIQCYRSAPWCERLQVVLSWPAQARLQEQVPQTAAQPKPLPLPDVGCAFFLPSVPLRFFDAAAGGAACSLSAARACVVSPMRSWWSENQFLSPTVVNGECKKGSVHEMMFAIITCAWPTVFLCCISVHMASPGLQHEQCALSTFTPKGVIAGNANPTGSPS